MLNIELTQDIDGRWIVTLPGLIVCDLSREAAEAFASAYRRLTGSATAERTSSDGGRS
ncbi:hypothetical protein [Methylobacterium sp. J-077]|uniref:hypothetical protein n=1 Tax=Methylobacterium sp. J-077 TaxID=2836656 RepID=UPI001FBB06A3|nr:hypothetical protein [Methylobacterium sp. J-077]MCJ2125845.1 hypothetical protein [Methylobacterium sp. J-077]